MQKRPWILALLCVACGAKQDPHNNPVQVLVTVSGTLQVLPFDTTNSPDFTQLRVAVVDPAQAITTPTQVVPLASAPLDATTCQNGVCTWSIPKVDITQVTLGLVLGVIDLRPAGSTLWAPVYSGIASGNTVALARAAKTTIQASPALAMTARGLTSIAGVTGVAAEFLQSRGLMLGLAFGKSSEAQGGSVPPLVSGVTATFANPNMTVWYPTADLTTSQSSTSTLGMFVASADSATLVFSTLALKAATGDQRTWTQATAGQVGSLPGSVLILEFEADP